MTNYAPNHLVSLYPDENTVGLDPHPKNRSETINLPGASSIEPRERILLFAFPNRGPKEDGGREARACS
jgi:hypothetical protein